MKSSLRSASILIELPMYVNYTKVGYVYSSVIFRTNCTRDGNNKNLFIYINVKLNVSKKQ